MIGAVIPTLKASGDLGFTAATLTTASTVGLVGVGIGAALIGPVTDRIGRRTTLIACIAWFSVFTIAVACAPNVGTFIVLRLLAGFGLGACLPIALTFMSEYAPAGSDAKAVTRTMTGYHVGAVITALLALWVIDAWGWEAMFVIGGVVGLLVLPVMWFKLPESEPCPPRAREKPSARCRFGPPAATSAVSLATVGRVVHGSAARLRAQHLAPDDDG